MKKAFVSWSGGKDCCLAAYQAGLQGFSVNYLVNMVTQDGLRSSSHGISAACIKLQAEALQIPILQNPATRESYESVFTATIARLKAEGVETGIFGDIDFNAHREWIDRVCGQAGITPVLPLWLKNQEQIALDFIKAGFTSIIVAVRSDLLGPEWLGRVFNAGFLKDLAAFNRDITPCGEAGEFHSLVIDGPLFKKRLAIPESNVERRDNHWFFNILKCELVEKPTGK
jgi:diphthine-ammonia ligase